MSDCFAYLFQLQQMERISAVFKLCIVFLITFIIHINKIHVDMYIPLILAAGVLLVYAYLNPDDPYIRNINLG